MPLGDLIDSLGVGVMVVHTSTGRVQAANAAAAASLGIEMAALVGADVRTPMWRLVASDGVALAQSEHPWLTAARSGEVAEGVVAADGYADRGWVRIVARPIGAWVIVTLSDVSGERAARERLDETTQAFARIVETMDEHVYSGELWPDGSYREVFSGPNAERLYGGAIDERVFQSDAWLATVHPDDRAAVVADIARLRSGLPSRVEYRIIGCDGVVRWVSDRATPRPPRPDGVVVIDGIMSDVSERRHAAEAVRAALKEAERRSRIDALTGLYNRGHFNEQLAAELARGVRNATSCALLLLDVDHFKQINDIYGHSVGDAILVEVATRLAGAVRPYDCVARWGGEEFAILAPGVGDEIALTAIARNLCGVVATNDMTAGEHQLRVTISVGAVLSTAAPGREALTTAADSALYAAKRAGRDQIRIGTTIHDGDSDPDIVRLARAVSIATSLRNSACHGLPEEHRGQVAHLAAATARKLELDVATQLRCRLAGWLHDIGNVALPDDLLNKRGPLDAQQRELIQTHPHTGADLAREFPAFEDVAPAILHHHERVDGTGYPGRLAGDEIPLEARIVAAAEAYAAMTASRPYKPTLTTSQAITELRRAAGGQLDPRIVDALCHVIEATAV